MEEDESPPSLHVCVNTRETLQARLLQTFLEQELSARCTINRDPESCISVSSLNNVPTVVLFDCSYTPVDELLHYFADMDGLPDRIIPALFNVQPDPLIEGRAVCAGIRGVFLCEQSPAQLVRGIGALSAGEVWISRRALLHAALHPATTPISQRDYRKELTRREIEILAMICAGASNDDIGNKLYISTNTVKTHIYNIYKKIKVPNRTQAALWAAKHL